MFDKNYNFVLVCNNNLKLYDMSKLISRKNFLSYTALAGATAAMGTVVPSLTSCSSDSSKVAYTPLRDINGEYVPLLPDKATDGAPLKVGLIGCGGRGSGAVENLLAAANGVTITALGDVFADRLEGVRTTLKDKYSSEVADANCFVGFDAYQKVIDSGVDAVMICTPPVFRPMHYKYAVEKGKHCFLEKPIAVDVAGYRTILASSKQADSQGLSVITGTQRHHQRCYVESYKKVVGEGLIGEITGGQVYWNQSMLWYRDREKGWTNMEWMIRDWVNWKWLSGDHIVEQHVHNIDVFLWFSGLKPVSAVGFGSRHRRVTGDQYDNFSIDFTMENGIHMHSMCRQTDGCENNVSEFIQGTKGSWSSQDGCKIKDLAGNIIWEYDYDAEKAEHAQTDPYTLELVAWVDQMRSGNVVNQAVPTAESSLAAIMGRESAYTGGVYTRESTLALDQDYMAKDLSISNVDMSEYTVRVPGK